MEALADKVLGVITSLVRLPLNTSSAFCVVYLASALVIALLVLWLRSRADGRASIVAVFGELFPRRIWWHRSARVDYAYFVVNAIVAALILTPVLLSAPVSAFGTAFVLEYVFGTQGPALDPSFFAKALLALAVLAAFDLGFFCAHFIMHRVGWLWEFHKVHHSAEVLTPITANRTHPVHDKVQRVLGAVTRS